MQKGKINPMRHWRVLLLTLYALPHRKHIHHTDLDIFRRKWIEKGIEIELQTFSKIKSKSGQGILGAIFRFIVKGSEEEFKEIALDLTNWCKKRKETWLNHYGLMQAHWMDELGNTIW